jgi:hypothetical protein
MCKSSRDLDWEFVIGIVQIAYKYTCFPKYALSKDYKVEAPIQKLIYSHCL